MATLIGDYGDQSRFHSMSMISAPSLQHTHSPPRRESQSHARYSRSISDTRDDPVRRQAGSSPIESSGSQRSPTQKQPAQAQATDTQTWNATGPTPVDSQDAAASHPHPHPQQQHNTSNGASRFPSPQSSSSASVSSGGARPQQHARPSSPPSLMASSSSTLESTTPSAATVMSRQRTGAGSIPSPESDGEGRWAGQRQQAAGPAAGSGPGNSSSSPSTQTQTTIRVRDLAHIQSLARADLHTGNGPGILNDPPLQAMKYEISSMPIGDVIEMVAALLTKITTTNDLQHDALNRNATHIKQAQAANSGATASSAESAETPHGGANMSPLASSVLAFHGKNVPAITILSYLSRIHKYCPTTYEVFLSLLVYFDRMTERVNELVMKSEERRMSTAAGQPDMVAAAAAATARAAADVDTVMRDESDESDEMDSDLADDDDDDDDDDDEVDDRDDDDVVVDDEPVPDPRSSITRTEGPRGSSTSSSGGAAARANVPPATSAAAAQATYFVVDSFNIHRLIIAGVTCASKFFSDVFYTNSRYAKVGGLPLAELNHLELQFLLLNDFRLAVPVEDLEAYATMLVEFYAREVVAQRSRPVGGMGMGVDEDT